MNNFKKTLFLGLFLTLTSFSCQAFNPLSYMPIIKSIPIYKTASGLAAIVKSGGNIEEAVKGYCSEIMFRDNGIKEHTYKIFNQILPDMIINPHFANNNPETLLRDIAKWGDESACLKHALIANKEYAIIAAIAIAGSGYLTIQNIRLLYKTIKAKRKAKASQQISVAMQTDSCQHEALS